METTKCYKATLADAPRISVAKSGWTRRAGHYVRTNRSLRYAVTLVITIDLGADKLPYVALYGYSVRADGVSYGQEHPLGLSSHAIVDTIKG